jgi:signal recognition particle subunit SRP54
MALNLDITLDDFARQLDRLLDAAERTHLIAFFNLRDTIPADTNWEQELGRIRAIIGAMTPRERREPDRLDVDHILRIALVSGTKPKDVSDFLRQFGELRVLVAEMLERRRF